ncbi:BRO family protein [Staphylococcus pseudintermedius]|uniref:BRO family protein n=1 Tax=Staphylococcus pseudintermedius TaxID=283734 RepID=UPI002EDABEB5
MQNLQTFNFEELPVRTLTVDEEPYFVGKDVASILGYSNTRDALNRHVDNEDKDVVKLDTLGGKQNQTLINESGLYSLIFSSKLDSAKRFKRWVTSEVLPAIRKTGTYQVPSDPMQALELMFEATKQTKEEIESVKADVIDLKENQKLDAGDYNLLSRTINQRVAHVQKLHAITNQKQRSELFRDINSEVKKMSGASSRTNVRQKHFDAILSMVANWFPSQGTLYKIKQLEMDFEKEV